MSCVKRRKSRRKYKHQPTDIDGLSQLLMKGSQSQPCLEDKGKSDGDFSCKSCLSKTSNQRSKHGRGVSLSPQETRKNGDANGLERISFRIANVTYEMDDNGDWTTNLANYDVSTEISKLRASNKKMSQQNNMIRVKNEVLADMIAKKTLSIDLIEAELKTLRKLLSKSSSRFSFPNDENNNDVNAFESSE